jgi:cyclopropane-fatty-acyl-phospholipid synthase
VGGIQRAGGPHCVHGAFEHFGFEKYDFYFKKTYDLLPDDGTIVSTSKEEVAEFGLPTTMSLLRFFKFIAKEIFPGGQVPAMEDIVEYSRDAGLSLGTTQLMNRHYVRTLDIWAANLQEHRDEAIATTSEEVYERYRRYLTGCADFFRRGITEVAQFAFTKE